MTRADGHVLESQFRKHLHYGLAHRLRAAYQRQRLGSLGAGVHIDRNVALMRFPKQIEIGDFVALKEGARICACNADARISIGSRTTIGYHSFIFSSERIEIGHDCLVAPFVYLVDSNHQAQLGQRINQQANTTSPVRIGNDVWIGAKATIVAGVTVGDGAVVASGAVVTRSVASNQIVGGVPAKVLGARE